MHLGLLKLISILFVLGISSFAEASSIQISHETQYLQSIVGHDSPILRGGPTDVGRAEVVTIESSLNSEADIARAYELASEALRNMREDQEHLLYYDIQNEQVRRSSEHERYASTLRNRLRGASVKTLKLSRDAIERLKRLDTSVATEDIRKLRNDPFKLRLTLVKVVSATSAAMIAVMASTGLPVSVDMALRALPTGLMSAAMLVWSDRYTKFIIRPGLLSRKIDDSQWFATVMMKLRKPFRSAQSSTSAHSKPATIRPGLYLDQALRSIIFLELPFVYISKLFTTGVAAANAAIPHILHGVIEGGIGQMTFDQAIAIMSESREQRARLRFSGADLDKKLQRIRRIRDVTMTVNSIFQVWTVLLASSGVPFMRTLLTGYSLAGVATRLAVIPIENSLHAAGVPSCGAVFAIP